MVKILPPHKPIVPATTPGTRVSVAPSPHQRFIDDVGYYDAMGRDPLQMFQVWGIKDETDRVLELENVLLEFPGSRHRRRLLMDAAIRGDAAIVKCLVQMGLKIQPDIPGRNGIPAKRRTRGEDDAMEGVASEGGMEGDDEVDDATDEEDEDDPDREDPTCVPIHAAALAGKLECVKIMIEDGKVPVDIRDEVGRTPLGAAAQGGHAELVKYLLEQGADPTIRLDSEDSVAQEYFEDLAGADILELSTLKPDLEIFKLLLEHPIYGSKRDRKWRNGIESGVYVTPLAVGTAASRRNFEALKYLLTKGSWPLEDKDGKTKGELLDDAQKKILEDNLATIIENGDYDSAMIMLSYLYPTDDNGVVQPFKVSEKLHRPFIWGAYGAMIHTDIKKFEWIRSFGLKEHSTMSPQLPEGQLLNIQHLLDRTSEHGSKDGVKYLIENLGSEPDKSRLPYGTRPIYYAAMSNRPDIVRYYLDNFPINIHFGNGAFASGPTALFVAIWMKSFECIELLLRAGGPVDSIDDEILEMKEPISAILITEATARTPVRLQTEANAAEYIEQTESDWQEFNPMNVRLELVPEDKEWISKLVPRKPDAELKETGEHARRLNRDDEERDDPFENLPHYAFSSSRAAELAGDEDIMPPWRPLLVPL